MIAIEGEVWGITIEFIWLIHFFFVFLRPQLHT